ncbi:hypothetical protein ACFQ9X_02305 [Catenulispora yoronensis]
MADLVVRTAAGAPVLAVVADAHWLDPESAAAIAVAVRATKQAPVGWVLGVDDVRRSPFGSLGAVTVAVRRAAGHGAADGHVQGVAGGGRQCHRARGRGRGRAGRLGLHVGDLAPAVADGLVEATGAGWRFRDHGVATAVYAAATPAERRATHAAFVEAIAELRAAEKGEILARHLAGAASAADAHAAEALGRAADGARLRGAGGGPGRVRARGESVP